MSDKYFITVGNFTDKDDLKYYLGSNDEFKKFWFKFAQQLGYFDYARSYASPYGREIELEVEGDNLNLKRSFLHNRLKIDLFNFKFTLDPQSISIEKITEKDLQTKEILLSNYRNYSQIEENIKKSLKLIKSTTTTFSSSHKIATSVGLEASTEVGVPFYNDKREVKFTFSYDYNMGNQKEQTETTQIWDEASLIVPPRTKTYLKLIVYTSSANAKFTAIANVSFNVRFKGWISVDDNVYKDQRTINPRGIKNRYVSLTYTFGNDKISALEDIRTQIANRNTPDDKSPWDWDKFLSRYQVKRHIIPYLNKDIASKFYGEFTNIDSTNVVVEFGPEEAL